MKAKTRCIWVGCALAALPVVAGPNWTGAVSTDWWTVGNWTGWPDDRTPESVPSAMGEASFDDWAINTHPNRTADLGGRTVELSGPIWVLTGAEIPVRIANGMVSCSSLNIRNASTLASLTLADVDLTVNGSVNVASHYEVGGRGSLTVESGRLSGTDLRLVQEENEVSVVRINGGEARFHWFCCSRRGGGDGLLELNGGTLKVPGFTYISWEGGPLAEVDGTTNINMRLVMNGGTLKAWPDNNGNINTGDFVPKWMRVTLGEGGAVIDTNGSDLPFQATNLTVVANDGGFTKKGAGTLKVEQGVFWRGPTKVLGGTLDLCGGTITGPLVLGGNGRIANGTIATKDITIQEGYVFKTGDWTSVDEQGVCRIASLSVQGAATVTSPLNGLLASASVWYDPSDAATLVKDANDGVIEIVNKGAGGTSMNGKLFYDERYFADRGRTQVEPPAMANINGLTALAFTNNITGFRTDGKVTFPGAFGKSVFAVGKRVQSFYDSYQGGTGKAEIYPIEWTGGSGIWHQDNLFGLSLQRENTWNYYRNAEGTVTWWNLYGANMSVDDVPYVASQRGKAQPAGEAPNIFARVTGLVSGERMDVSGSCAEALENANDGKARVTYGWSMGLGRSSNGIIGEALAFARCLNETEAKIVQSYLGRKWISSEIPEEYAMLAFGSLALDNDAALDLERTDATIGTLSGAGRFVHSGRVSVTGTIEPRLAESGAAFAVSGSVDVTGARLVLDEADLADWAYDASRTVLTAASLVGVPAVSVPAGGKGKYVVSNTGTALVVTRVPAGMVVVVR